MVAECIGEVYHIFCILKKSPPMPPREEKKHKWMLFDILDYRSRSAICVQLSMPRC